MELIKQNIVGVLGLIALCVAIPLSHGAPQNVINVVGISALIIYAWQGRNTFFLYLELIVLLGTLLQIAEVSPVITWTTLTLSFFVTALRLLQNPAYRNFATILGFTGLAGLVFGYATLNPIGYAIGGVCSACYSIILFRQGIKSGLLFALLNVIYGALAIYVILN